MKLSGISLFLVLRKKLKSNLVFVVVLILGCKGLYYYFCYNWAKSFQVTAFWERSQREGVFHIVGYRRGFA